MLKTAKMLVLEFRVLRSRSGFKLISIALSLSLSCRYVEDKYKLEIGNAQNSQLSRALANGTEKNIFVLPKGMYFILYVVCCAHIAYRSLWYV